MARSKTAFITGISGQDGAYLADFLLQKNYQVHGLVRWDSYADPMDGLGRLEALDLIDRVTIHTGDLTDVLSVATLIKDIQPDEIYNLAALSQVGVSFDTPASTFDINTMGAVGIFEALRLLDMGDRVRVYQASSSEMFGNAHAPQNEQTMFDPCSPYGVAKVASYMMTRMYREAYGFHASNGILFNHESPIRGEDFVTRKITKAVAEIEVGRQEPLQLGNLNSIRDWGHARDYTRGMWMILQHNQPDDFVLATGQARSVRDFVVRAFAHIGIPIEWLGEGENEIGRHAKSKKVLVEVSPEFFRPQDVNHLLGDATKAKTVLGWKPEINFDKLVSEMVNQDRRLLQQDLYEETPRWTSVG